MLCEHATFISFFYVVLSENADYSANECDIRQCSVLKYAREEVPSPNYEYSRMGKLEQKDDVLSRRSNETLILINKQAMTIPSEKFCPHYFIRAIIGSYSTQGLAQVHNSTQG